MLFLLATLLFTPAPSASPTPIPSEYNITVHVQASHLINHCSDDTHGSNCNYVNHLNTLIEGKKLELEDTNGDDGLLRTGDYPAKLVEGPESSSYKYKRFYEFLFPDGKTRKLRVVGESE